MKSHISTMEKVLSEDPSEQRETKIAATTMITMIANIIKPAAGASNTAAKMLGWLISILSSIFWFLDEHIPPPYQQGKIMSAQFFLMEYGPYIFGCLALQAAILSFSKSTFFATLTWITIPPLSYTMIFHHLSPIAPIATWIIGAIIYFSIDAKKEILRFRNEFIHLNTFGEIIFLIAIFLCIAVGMLQFKK